MGKTTGYVPTSTKSTTSAKVNRTMQLFGLPYQFLPQVDQRNSSVSSTVGHAYMENIMADASIVTIIPGEPRYLPGQSSEGKAAYTNALLDAASGNFAGLAQRLTDDDAKDIQLYGFEPAYHKTFGYINIMCRTCAAFLDLKDTGYKINGDVVDFLNYDWKNYRWDGQNYTGTVVAATSDAISGLKDKIVSLPKTLLNSVIDKAGKIEKFVTGKLDLYDDAAAAEEISDETSERGSVADRIDQALKNGSFIQFYTSCDSANASDSLTNSAQASSFSSLLDQGSSTMRDLAFLNQSGGILNGDEGIGAAMQKLGNAALSALSTSGNITSNSHSLGSRLAEAGGAVMMGENFVMPEIWGGSDNQKSYTIELKFKAPYGNTLCWYTDVLVPVCFCIGIAYPRSTGPNTYKSPPLVKMYRQGVCVCNLGLVTSIEINRDEVKESMNIDGQITEVTVNLTIQDLYSQISTNPANDPIGFYKNASLTEYLGTMCGLDLTQPNMKKKGQAFMNNAGNWVASKVSSVGGAISEKLDSAVLNWTKLTKM